MKRSLQSVKAARRRKLAPKRGEKPYSKYAQKTRPPEKEQPHDMG